MRNIYYQANNEEILEYMQAAGTIVDYSIKKEDQRVSGQFTYGDNESAVCAVKCLENLKICGSNRELKVKLFSNTSASNTECTDEHGKLIDVFDKIEHAPNLEEAILSMDEHYSLCFLRMLR